MQSENNEEKILEENRIVNEGKKRMKKREEKAVTRKKREKTDTLDQSDYKTAAEKTEHLKFLIASGMAGVMAALMVICIILAVWNRNDSTKGASPSTAKSSIDVDALAKKILDNVAFDVELDRLEDSVAEGMVQMSDGTKLQIYLGNGASADELVLMTATSEKNAEMNQKYIEEHLNEKKRQFQLYMPEQVKKIENAVKLRTGSYVIVCITSDVETAKKTITSFIQTND